MAGADPFASLTQEQREKLRQYEALLRRFNQRLNLISREDETHIETHHIRHCLELARCAFPAGSAVVDWGTGGGLPAIPLAVAFPGVTVYAVDSVEKKVQAVRTIARRLGLENLYPWHGRAEDWPGAAHFSVSRATAPLADLWRWHARIAEPLAEPLPEQKERSWPPGLLCLKGGDLRAEVAALKADFPNVQVEQSTADPGMERGYFADKYILAVTSQTEQGA